MYVYAYLEARKPVFQRSRVRVYSLKRKTKIENSDKLLQNERRLGLGIRRIGLGNDDAVCLGKNRDFQKLGILLQSTINEFY